MHNENLQQSHEQCPFCRIIHGESPAKVIYRDDYCLAFKDIHPKAEVHILIIPLKHIPSVNEVNEEDKEIIGHLVWAAAKIVTEIGADRNGYRLVINTGERAGQTVFHLHIHLLSGRLLTGY